MKTIKKQSVHEYRDEAMVTEAGKAKGWQKTSCIDEILKVEEGR